MERSIGDVVIGTAQKDMESYVCVLTEVDHTKVPGPFEASGIENYDIGLVLKGPYRGRQIRLDRCRVVMKSDDVAMKSDDLVKLAESNGYDMHTPAEIPLDR